MPLDQDQSRVVAEFSGPRSVVAGPGSGKTTTMVAFVDRLIEAGVSPSQIRALTFSKEMATALEKKIKIKGVASTFHSLGYLICSETERKPVEPELRYRLMCKLCKKWGLDYKEFDGFIAKMRRANITPTNCMESGEYNYGFASAYVMYENARAEQGWMDFDSMLADSVTLLENPVVRARWQPKYLIVDEAQDTDDCQWRMMQLMAATHNNITVVGDPNQAIYGFRGAKPDNITNFEQWFPDGNKFYLGKNYRCHPPGVLIETCKQSGNRNRVGVLDQTPIETLQDGQKSVTWQRRSGRFRLRGQKTVRTEYWYDGDLVVLETENRKLPLTPNHDILVRLNDAALDKYVVYLMWKRHYGYRIGHSRLSVKQKGKTIHRIWHRIHKQKPDKIWFLRVCDTKHIAYFLEQRLSAQFSILQTPYLPEKRTDGGLTVAETQQCFQSQQYCGAADCLKQHHLLEENPLLTLDGDGFAALSNGFFKTAAANAWAQIMDVPVRDDNQTSQSICHISHEAYRGVVHSLSVAEEHNYIANGIVVGNSTQTIVKFVRENAPEDTPKELLDRMVAARDVKGAPIGLKMYWSDDAEAESALTLAQRDPLNSIILARTNRMVGLLERLCQRHNVRYHLMGKTGFWKQNEIRKAVEAMKEYPMLSVEQACNVTLPALESKYAVDDRTERDNDALENLKTLRIIGQDFKSTREFTAYANKMMHRRNDPRGVSISTVHQAKGGEWKNVFIIGATAKGFPHPKGDPKEEKRIYFVAISRPIDNLRISFAGTPSPYLRRYLTEEILDKLREHAAEVDQLQSQQKLFA